VSPGREDDGNRVHSTNEEEKEGRRWVIVPTEKKGNRAKPSLLVGKKGIRPSGGGKKRGGRLMIYPIFEGRKWKAIYSQTINPNRPTEERKRTFEPWKQRKGGGGGGGSNSCI